MQVFESKFKFELTFEFFVVKKFSMPRVVWGLKKIQT